MSTPARIVAVIAVLAGVFVLGRVAAGGGC
jgi:hypothetical protein